MGGKSNLFFFLVILENLQVTSRCTVGRMLPISFLCFIICHILLFLLDENTDLFSDCICMHLRFSRLGWYILTMFLYIIGLTYLISFISVDTVSQY